MPSATPGATAVAEESAASALSAPGPFGFGRAATKEEIQAWDIDVRPDGTGLPPGKGTVAQGANIYAAKCAVCHGEQGQGVRGAGGALIQPYSKSEPWPPFPRTVGNYWPYATTLFDYVNRAMPANAPGSLKADEVYSVVAWLLYKNQIIAVDSVISDATLPSVKMPAADRFVPAPGTPAE